MAITPTPTPTLWTAFPGMNSKNRPVIAPPVRSSRNASRDVTARKATRFAAREAYKSLEIRVGSLCAMA